MPLFRTDEKALQKRGRVTERQTDTPDTDTDTTMERVPVKRIEGRRRGLGEGDA
jgi:hypothetical protein